MRQLPLLVLGALLLGGGFFHAWQEQSERRRLERRIESLQAKLDAMNDTLQDTAGGWSSAAGGDPLARAQRSARAGAEPPPKVGVPPRGAAFERSMPGAKQEDLRVRAGERPAELLALLESDDPVVRERMRKLVAEQEQALRDEERVRRQAAWEERTSKRLDELAKQVSLTPQQVDALFAILTASRDKIGEAFRAARESHDFGQAEEQIEQYEKEADEEARGLLDAKQYEAYEAMRADEAQRRGWGGRETGRSAPAERPATR